MRYFILINEFVRLYAVNYAEQTISRIRWDSDNKIHYNPDYDYDKLPDVESLEEINEEQYFTWTDAINDAMRIGSVPTKPPQ